MINIIYFNLEDSKNKFILNDVYNNFLNFLSKQTEKINVYLVTENPFQYKNFFNLCNAIIELGHYISLTCDVTQINQDLFAKFLQITVNKLIELEINLKLPLKQNFYEKIIELHNQYNLEAQNTKIYCELDEAYYNEIKNLKQKFEKTDFKFIIQRQKKNNNWKIYSNYIEEELKSNHWLRTEQQIDIPLSFANKQNSFIPESKICFCGSKCINIQADGIVKRCFTSQLYGWDELGNFAKSSEIRLLSENSPCFSVNKNCNCYKKLRSQGLIYDKEDIQIDNRTTKYDVAVVGYGWAYNYGAILTNYGLMNFLIKNGFNPLMVEKPRDFKNNNYTDEVYAQTFARKFNEKYFSHNLSRIYNNKNDMKALNSICNTFILGSDQTLRYDLHKSGQYYIGMDFLNDDKKRIAYSSGLGHFEYMGDEWYNVNLHYYLSKYDYIAVREPSTVNVLKEQFNVDAVNVIDPMYFIDINEYNYLASQSDDNCLKDCLLAFILTPDREYKKQLDKLAKVLSREVVVVAEYWNVDILKSYGFKNVICPSVETWINYIKNARFVVTDSFHAVYSLITMEKPFLLVVNNNVDFKRGLARFPIFTRVPEINKRIIYGIDKIGEYKYLFNEINFKQIKSIFDEQKNFSTEWLLNAINTPKCINTISSDENLRILHDKINILYEKINNLSYVFQNNNKRINEISDNINKFNLQIDKLISTNKFNQHKGFIQNLFSINNNNKHKIITILGIRIKIKGNR